MYQPRMPTMIKTRGQATSPIVAGARMATTTNATHAATLLPMTSLFVVVRLGFGGRLCILHHGQSIGGYAVYSGSPALAESREGRKATEEGQPSRT